MQLTEEQQSENIRRTFMSGIDGFPNYRDIHVMYLKAGKYQADKTYPIQEFIDSIVTFISSKQHINGFNCFEWHLKTTLMYNTEMYCIVKEYYDPGMGFDDEVRCLDAVISSDQKILVPYERPKPSARQQRKNK